MPQDQIPAPTRPAKPPVPPPGSPQFKPGLLRDLEQILTVTGLMFSLVAMAGGVLLAWGG